MKDVFLADTLVEQLQSPRLVPSGHPFYLVTEPSPIVRLQLGILDQLLAPVLMQSANVVLALLEIRNFIPDALLDENSPCMLLYDRLLVLYQKCLRQQN